MRALNRTMATAVSWAGSEYRLVRSGLSIALLALVLALLLPVAASASTRGPNFPASASDSGGGPGAVAWSGLGNIVADDSSYASAAMPASGLSDYLEASDFGFAIPDTATIDGISVSIMRMANGADVQDVHVYLMKGLKQTAGDRAGSAFWPSTMTAASYGGPSDLWNNTWTPAEINASTFGVALQAWNIDLSAGATAYVDYITVTVTYHLPAVPLTVTATGVSKVYDGTTSATVTLASADIASGDDVTLSYTGAAFADKNVGASKTVDVSGISISGDDATNYTLQNTTAATTADITPKALTVTAGDQSKAYGSTFTFAGTEFSTAGLVSGDAVDSATLSSAGAAAGATPGTYPITVSTAVGTGLGNYDIAYVDGTMAVGAGYKVAPFAKPLRHGDPRRFHLGDTIRVAFRVRDAEGKYVTGAKPRLRLYRGGKIVLGPKTVRYVAGKKMYVYSLHTKSSWKAATYKIHVKLAPGSTGRSVFIRVNPTRPAVIPAYRG